MSTTCQICERSIKLKNGVITRHGYRVLGRGHGGYGQQVGASCRGSGAQPYELSCALLPSEAEACARAAAQSDALADRIVSERLPVPGRLVRSYSTGQMKALPATEPSDPFYALRLREFTSARRQEAAAARAAELHYRKRIEAWRPQV